VSADQIAALGRMVEQTQAVFGAPPFKHYEILARLEPDGSTGGTEHRSSSEITLPATYFSQWSQQLNGRDILPHEFVHAWNGIYRRPAGQVAATPNEPLSSELLWIYEGQTEFWGRVLAARSGLRTLQETRDQIALDAAAVAGAAGRQWKSLDDDVNYPAFMLGRPVPWRDWQRRRDYYQEGVLLWLNVESALREQSGGRKGLDDVARRMFADAPDDATVLPYTIEDWVDTLNAVAPGDWRAWLASRITGHGEVDLLAGLHALGWRLVFSDTPTETDRQSAAEYGVTDLAWSIGLTADRAGRLRSVAWQGPAFVAGMAPGNRLLKVGDVAYSPAALTEAVRQATDHPVVLSFEQDGQVLTRTLNYQGPLRHPRLERIEGQPDRLGDLLAARSVPSVAAGGTGRPGRGR
jgi:predicted metalloprotease with PDZ domain